MKKQDPPTSSQSKHPKQQRFGALASYYKEKMKAAAPDQNDSRDELIAIKMELSDLKEWAKKKKHRPRKRRVQFSRPLVSSLHYRPKTAPEDIELLYFQEDELQDWEDDRETTPSERFEVTITDDVERVNISADCRSHASYDSHA